MRFTTARLCGGKSLMAISADPMDIDMDRAAEEISARGLEITQRDEMMIVFQWNGMEATLYPQGKVMFFPLADKEKAVEYATDIIERISG